MQLRTTLRLALSTSLVLVSSLALAAAPVPAAPAEFGGGNAKAVAMQNFLATKPGARLREDKGRIQRVYGRAFSNGGDAVESAENFRLNHAAMFGVHPLDLVKSSRFSDGRQTQPIMLDRAKGAGGGYKFTGVYYSQSRDGFPVFGGELVLLVRNEPGFPTVLASSSLRDLGGFRLARKPIGDPTVAQVLPAAQRKLGGEARVLGHAHYVIWAGTEDQPAEPRLAIQFIAESGLQGTNSHQKWLIVADAMSGQSLYETSLILHGGEEEGVVLGRATEGLGADVCDEEPLTPMPYVRIPLLTGEVYADAQGQFTIPTSGGGGGKPFTITTELWGQFFRVFNDAIPTTTASDTAGLGGPLEFIFNPDNDEEFVRAEVNGYLHANIVRDYVLSFHPEYPGVFDQVEMPVTVNIDATCNASYDGVGINFRRSGSECPNTALSTVVYHEYGHHLVASSKFSGQGAYGEGMSDSIGVIVSDTPETGLGWNYDCDEPLRSAINDRMYPCDGGIHFCGQVLSGCVWDTREELVLTEPSNYRQIISDLTINSIIFHVGTSINPSITIDFLTLDDDDDEILNGTPHYDEIAAGFGAHNMDAPQLALLAFDFKDGQPDFIAPSGGTTLRVEISGVTDTPVAGGAAFFVDAGNGFVPGQLNEIAPNVYDAVFPASDCGGTVRYYFSAAADGGGVEFNPVAAPAASYAVISAAGAEQPVFDDDFETDQLWSVVDGPGLTDGSWDRGVPAGGGDRGDPPFDADGSGQCYLTHNEDGNTDVDGGATTLISPIMDGSGEEQIISYSRWYSNTSGDDPMNDVFVVDVSSDGGASWVNLETVGPAGAEVAGGWFSKQFNVADFVPLTSQFRIRFTASDFGDGSIVEAGVDGVALTPLNCAAPLFADLDGDGIVNGIDLALLLGEWGPCAPAGGCPADLNGDGIVNGIDLALLLGAWS